MMQSVNNLIVPNFSFSLYDEILFQEHGKYQAQDFD
jgi:hypothetical protein